MPRIPQFQGGNPYANQYETGDRIADIILRGGQQQAELAQRGGDIWSNAVSGIGQTLGEGLQAWSKARDDRAVAQAIQSGTMGSAPLPGQAGSAQPGPPDPNAQPAGTIDMRAILNSVPPERQAEVIKGVQAVQSSSSAIAERNAKIAHDAAETDKTRVLTQKAREDLIQGNQNDLATIGFRVKPYLAGQDGGMGAALIAVRTMKEKGLDVSQIEAPLHAQADAWTKAQQAGDPAALAALVAQNRQMIGSFVDHTQFLATPEHMDKLRGKPLDLAPEHQLLDPNDPSRVIASGAPKPETRSIDVQLAALQPGSPEYVRLLRVKRDEAATGRDPNADAAPMLTPAARDMAAKRYLQDGTLPAAGMGKTGAALRADIMNRAGAIDPEANLALNKAGYGANAASVKALQKQTDAVTAFESTASKNAALLDSVLSKLPDSGTSLLNKPVRAVASALGSEDMATVNALRQSVQNEYSRIISNPTLSGTMSDSARKEGEALMSPDATVGQLRAAMRALAAESGNRRTSYQEQIDTITKRLGGKGGTSAADPLGIR